MLPPDGGQRVLDVVAFDLMDTVVHDPFREALTEACGRTFDEAISRSVPVAWQRFERGELSEQEYFASYDLDLDTDAFHRVRRRGYAMLPGMRRLLSDLAGHVTRATATNYPVWVEELTEGLLAGLFDQVVASHHLAVRKPQRAFFERLCGTLDKQASRVLLVDDRIENVEGARAAGMRAHLFLGETDLRERLLREGLPL